MLSDYFIFVRELPKSFSQIGAMLPSSPLLGKKMVRPIREANRPLKILEVGPGTGPFTRQILRLMGPKDHFVICEINPRFVAYLRRFLSTDPYYQRHKERVSFFQGPVQELPESEEFPAQYDVIISSLPFINFSPDTVEEILALFQSMVRDGGSLAFCQYVGICKFRELFANPRTRKRVKGVDEVIHSWCDKVRESGSVSRKISLFNVPPATSIVFNYRSAA